MIASLKGLIQQKQPTRLVLDVGGVGYEVLVPLPTAATLGGIGEGAFLHTVQIVREDSLTLYGFATLEERSLFQKLIGVSGIGPKIALNALSGPPIEEMVGAIRTGDIALLTRLPGIGKKTAERLVVELKDRLGDFGDGERAPATTATSDAEEALVSLGYSRSLAEKAVKRAMSEAATGNAEALLRSALRVLTGGK